jgi:hypothetical protein
MTRVIHSIRGLLSHARKVADVALDRAPAGRRLTVFPGDIFIVSYPKSGNTWTRFLLGNLIYEQEPITFANVESRLPSIYVHSDRKLKKLPRVLKSHDCFDPRYKTVIYIVRDPRDVVVSAYHYSIKVGILREDCPIQDFVPKFMSGTFGSGLLADPRWGSWYDNVMSWLAMRHNRKFLLLRYEDILDNAERELLRVSRFLEIEPTPDRLSRAVKLSSADHMRKLEQKESAEWALTKATRQDKPFVRTAKAGTWRSALLPRCVAEIERAWGSAMSQLGYELTQHEMETENSGGPHALFEKV